MSLWCGQEWEIAFSGVNAAGITLPTPTLLDKIDKALVRNVLHVDNESVGWWLGSGGKFYRDASDSGHAHSEYASPECDHPDELLRQDIASERLMLRLAELVKEDDEILEVHVSKANVCGVSLTSWGSHENYEASKHVPETPMLAWLASRIVMTGAGGLDVTYPGIRFTLSPRAHFITEQVNSSTQWNRGLHNIGKAAPYGKRHRVHVVAGDGNRMPLSTWLRFGTTALAIRLLDKGRSPHVGLLDPVMAMHDFALDTSLATCVMAVPRAPTSALGIQRAFLTRAHEETRLFPDWAPRVLAEWQRVIDSLEAKDGWRGLVGQLDWPTKLALFEMVLERKGWTWDRVNEVNRKVEMTWNRLRASCDESVAPDLSEQTLVHNAVLREAAAEYGREWMNSFTDLKKQLAAVDARYMQLGGDSLCEKVAVPVAALNGYAADLPADPLELPLPTSGRASVRAKLVREHGWIGAVRNDTELKSTLATWTRFVANGKMLDMPDVNDVRDTTWRDFPSDIPHIRESRGYSRDPVMVAIEMVHEAVHLAGLAIDSGAYPVGADAMDRVRGVLDTADISTTRKREYWRYSARLMARQQRQMETIIAVQNMGDVEPKLIEWLWESCNARILLGLAGHPSVPEAVALVKSELESCPDARLSGIACWKAHLAVWLSRHGRVDEAFDILQSARTSNEYESTSESVKSRMDSQLGEIWRMRGDFARSGEYLSLAYRCCTDAGLDANRMDYALTGQARLAADMGERDAAYLILHRQVLPNQLSLGMPSAMRTMMLIGRVMPERGTRRRRASLLDSLRRQISEYSGLASCPRAAKVLRHWEEWCGGAPDPDPPAGADNKDTFWGI